MRAEFGGERLGAVAHGGQAAAFLRAFGAEGGKDGASGWTERCGEVGDVGLALGGFGQEMENGAVMPEIEGCGRECVWR